MDLLKLWRESGWKEVGSDIYWEACQLFGCSVITHPVMVEAISSMTNTQLRYLAYYDADQLVGAIPLWGKYLAGSKKYLKKTGKNRIIDTGNAEVILPLNTEQKFNIHFKGEFLSSIHVNQISTLKPMKDSFLSMARSYQPKVENSLSKKFRYNKRRELKQFEESGGYYRNAAELSGAEFCEIYTSLFFNDGDLILKDTNISKFFLKKFDPYRQDMFFIITKISL